MKLLSTPQVAERLGVTIARVQTFIWAGRLPAQKVGRDYVIQEDDLRFVENRKTGRPPKAKAATGSAPPATRTVTPKTRAMKKGERR